MRTIPSRFNAFAGYGIQRPNLVGDPTLLADERTPAHWFNTAAFAVAPQFTLGSASRNPVRGPAYRDVDLAFMRRVPVHAGTALEVRAEIAIREAFTRIHEDETCFYVGDSSFWRVARELAGLGFAQIHVEADHPSGAAGASGPTLPRGTIAATALGRRVLGGGIDRVRHSGIDRWLGGIHLTGQADVWRWDQSAGRIVRG